MNNNSINGSNNVPSSSYSHSHQHPRAYRQHSHGHSHNLRQIKYHHPGSKTNIASPNIGPNPLKLAYNIFAIFTISLCAIGLSTSLILLYVCVRPFSLPTYRRLSCNMCAAAFLDAAALVLPNTRLYLSGDSDVPSPVGASVLVCNHSMDADWWAILMLCRCVGLRGSVKAFLQRSSTNASSNFNSEPDASSNSPACILANNTYGDHKGSKSPKQSIATFSDKTITNSKSNSSIKALSNPIVTSISAPNIAAAFTSSKASNPTISRNHSHQNVLPPHQNLSPVRTHSYSQIHTNNSPQDPLNSSSTIPSEKSSQTSSSNNSSSGKMSLAGYLLHNLLEYPLLSPENNKHYVQDRDELFTLLRSFAKNGATAPVHLLLFPEGWSSSENRKTMLAKSVEFAKREGRPVLKHLLLPRTTGFYASLESLRESSPVIYDVTMAYGGYDGDNNKSGIMVYNNTLDGGLSWSTLWRLVSGQTPSEVHIRIKKYSMEEVLQDAQWLDKKWAEKDRLLSHFSRHQHFPLDTSSRSYCRHWIFNSRGYSVENSLAALIRLVLVPFAIPVIILLSIPVLWMVMWLWLARRAFMMLFPSSSSSLGGDYSIGADGAVGSEGEEVRNGNNSSNAGTPFLPATPFASPTHMARWRSNDSPGKR